MILLSFNIKMDKVSNGIATIRNLLSILIFVVFKIRGQTGIEQI